MTSSRDFLEERLRAFESAQGDLKLSLCGGSSPSAPLMLELDGALDGANSDSFREFASLALAESRSSGGLVLGLARLRYISSTGVGALVNILSESMRSGPALYLKGISPSLRVLFEALGFSRIFSILDAEGGAT